MNHHKTDNNGALVNTAPLFASVWLALFNVLRKSFIEWRMAAVNAENSQEINKS